MTLNIECQWKEGIVNTENEHIKLYHGEFDSSPQLVALLSPPCENCFTVQFLFSREPNVTKIFKEVIEDLNKELDFYLVEHPKEYHGPDDPWQYCIYHTTTQADMRSLVHWVHYPGEKPKKENDGVIVYGKHPSKELQDLFREKPYQGQDPKKARVIIFGIDANYSEEILAHSFRKYVIEYHKNGVEFWKTYGKHHPFLIKEYPFFKNKAGVPYHRNFGKLNLDERYADCISFVELLGVPTIGNTNENGFRNLFDRNHGKWIDSIVTDNANPQKLILLSDSVIRKMRDIKKECNIFNWIPDSDDQSSLNESKPTELHTVLVHKVYKVFHFSYPGIHTQIPGIRKLIDNLCGKN